ncbi:hypothetical protein GJ496_007583 [Pomphorhynchus laevis]|nr:hypothetical protein GJ496_007583 [Pomphorhynchus laevis]
MNNITVIELLKGVKNAESYIELHGTPEMETIVVGGKRYPVIREQNKVLKSLNDLECFDTESGRRMNGVGQSNWVYRF